jgi:tetratricopeptide (TPR) repeat protein/O-antigen ligase
MRARDAVAAGFGVAAIELSIFAIGGRPRWAQMLVALAVAGALIPLVTSRRTFARKSPLVVLAAIAVLVCAIQLLPLPHGLLEALDPVGTGLRDDGAALAGNAAGSTISLDVPGTLDALIFFATLLGLAIVALRISTSDGGRYRINALVAASCGAYALVTGFHRVFDIYSLYGVYDDTGGPPMLGPLLNSNQTACLTAVGAVVAIGLAMYQRQRAGTRVIWFTCAIACAVVCLLTESRGGALALAAGGFVTVATLVTQRFSDPARRPRNDLLSRSLPIGIVAICAIVVVIYASAGGIKGQFEQTSWSELHAPRSKFVAWRSAMTLIDEAPWSGIGRGAFEPVFQRVHPASAFATYTHVENEYLQAVIDWGVPVAVVLSFVAIWLVVAALRRWRDGPLTAGVFGALVAVALQSNVDFGVEFLGIAAPCTALAATLVYVPLRDTTPRRLAMSRLVRIAHVAGLVVAALLLSASITTPIDEDHDALEHDPTIAAREVVRHPFDYYGYARLAETAFHDGKEANAIQLLNHALTLHPTDPGLHVAAARLLYAAKHPEQAAIEYAAALPAARDPRRLLAEVTQRLPLAAAASALPPDVERIDQWLQILAELQRDDVALAWLERVVLLEPRAAHACESLFRLATHRGDLDAIDVMKHRCLDFQASEEDRVALGHVLQTKHDPAAIAALLADVESWSVRTDIKLDAWQMLCEAWIDLGKLDDARHCLHQIEGMGMLPADRTAKIVEDLERVDKARASGSPN